MTAGPEIRLIQDPETDWWTAKDMDTGVASQGETREAALENLDEAVGLYRGEIGESIDSWEEEKAVLEELGIDPAEVKANREAYDGLPEFLQ
jgi:predicted RNase H-like HicB family nuclease